MPDWQKAILNFISQIQNVWMQNWSFLFINQSQSDWIWLATHRHVWSWNHGINLSFQPCWACMPTGTVEFDSHMSNVLIQNWPSLLINQSQSDWIRLATHCHVWSWNHGMNLSFQPCWACLPTGGVEFDLPNKMTFRSKIEGPIPSNNLKVVEFD